MKQIIFDRQYHAALIDVPDEKPTAGQVRVKMHYTAISAGTERANLVGMPNTGGVGIDGSVGPYPRGLGYSGSGVVEEIGPGVTDLQIGDRVITYWGQHKQYNTLPAGNVVKIPSDSIAMEQAAFIFISTFPLAAVRKVRPELGESTLVVGLGLLGLFAVQFAHLAGALPVIAADPNPARRELALRLGADYALDPTDPGYTETLRQLTGKGANTVIEVTGNPEALTQALRCTARFGRVALLGCSRLPATVDFYRDVHCPGITLVGAHTNARPMQESHPGYWTHTDDCRAALAYLAVGRLNIGDMISEIHPPEAAEAVFDRLAFDPNFPIGVAFDWLHMA